MRSNDSDALVIFGITGDLAKKQTLRSLYRLEARGLLRCPVIGVAADHWTVERLRQHGRESIRAAGEQLYEEVFARFAGRLGYLSGEFTDQGTYSRMAAALGDAENPVFYLEIPPSLFATVVQGLARVDLVARGQRAVVEKPFGHDLRSARALAADLHKFVGVPSVAAATSAQSRHAVRLQRSAR